MKYARVIRNVSSVSKDIFLTYLPIHVQHLFVRTIVVCASLILGAGNAVKVTSYSLMAPVLIVTSPTANSAVVPPSAKPVKLVTMPKEVSASIAVRATV